MPLIEIETTDGVATLRLNRPDQRNALSTDLCFEIVDGLGAIDAYPDVNVMLITGAGDIFCSGADFAAVSGPEATRFLDAFEQMLEALARHRLPTVAVVQGAALGGGLQLATVCDFRIAASDAKVGIPSSRIGIVVNFENVQRLVQLVGAARAKEILMTGRTYEGNELLDTGLATAVVAPSELSREGVVFAAQLAALAPLSLQGAKKAIQTVLDAQSVVRTGEGPAETIDGLVAQAYSSGDLQEGLTAMKEKRSPRFEGR